MGITRKGRFKTPDFALDYCVESELLEPHQHTHRCKTVIPN